MTIILLFFALPAWSTYEVETFTGVVANYVYSPDTMKNIS